MTAYEFAGCGTSIDPVRHFKLPTQTYSDCATELGKYTPRAVMLTRHVDAGTEVYYHPIGNWAIKFAKTVCIA